MTESKPQKIALVHDFLVSYGGAERVLQSLAALYPEAPIYTLVSDARIVARYFPGRTLRHSFLQRFPRWIRTRYQWLLPLYPVAIETLDLRAFDLVISSSSAWSKGIITRLHTRHIAYIHSPLRYVWEEPERYMDDTLPWCIPRFVARLWFSYLRLWDRQAAERPDRLLANSVYTQTRIAKYYRKESTVVYPPAFFAEERSEKELPRGSAKRFFLVVSRLTRSKKIMPVIEAFNKLGFPLVIVGEGHEKVRLRRMAGAHISFVGSVSEARLRRYYQEARAVLFPSEEDFGMVAVEALSSGTPVIAYEYGGIREILRIGTTGETFHSQTPEVIAEAVKRFIEKEVTGQYEATVLRDSVRSFSREAFEAAIRHATEG